METLKTVLAVVGAACIVTDPIVAIAEDFVPTTSRPAVNEWQNPSWKYDHSVTYNCEGHSCLTIGNATPYIIKNKTGINKPNGISEDYVRAICDLSAIIGTDSRLNTTITYDDGEITFKCGRR
jgi:hypothetical protein